jgi:predicted transcriptional regulator YheO
VNASNSRDVGLIDALQNRPFSETNRSVFETPEQTTSASIPAQLTNLKTCLIKLQSNAKVALARQLFASKEHSIPELCSVLGISRATLYRYVKEARISRVITKNQQFNLKVYTLGYRTFRFTKT